MATSDGLWRDDTADTSTVLDVAKSYMELGWRVLPLEEDPRREEATGVETGELLRNAASSPGEVEALWAKRPGAPIGLLTGSASGVAVVRITRELPPDLAPLLSRLLETGAPRAFFVDGTTSLLFACGTEREIQTIRAQGFELWGDGYIARLPARLDDRGYPQWEQPPADEVPELPTSVDELASMLSEFPPAHAEAVDAGLDEQSMAITVEPIGTDTPVLLQLDEIEPRPIEWLLKDRIPLGETTLLSAPPGYGKSAITVDLAARITVGGESPLGDGPMAKGGVILMGREDRPAEVTRPRLEAAGGDPARLSILNDKLTPFGKRPLRLPGDIAILRAACVQRDARLVVLDPISDFLYGRSSNSEEAIREALMPLRQLAEELNIAIVLVRHHAKSARGGALNRTLGSVAFGAVVRSALEVAKFEGGRALVVTKSNLASTRVPAMRFDIGSVEGPGDTMVPVVTWGELDEQVRSESRSKLDEARDWIVEVLGDGPVLGSRVRAAAKDRGISERTLAKAKKALLIRSEPPGGPTAKWMPPDHLCIPARPKGNGRDAQMAVEEVRHG